MAQPADGGAVLGHHDRVPDVSRPCGGCLDSRECWVCSGTGYHHPVARRGLCDRCAGTGVCSMCADTGVEAEPEIDLRLQEPTIPAPRGMPAPTVKP